MNVVTLLLVSFMISCFKCGEVYSMVSHRVRNFGGCDKYQVVFGYKKNVKFEGKVGGDNNYCALLCYREKELCLSFGYQESEKSCELTLYKNFNNLKWNKLAEYKRAEDSATSSVSIQ